MPKIARGRWILSRPTILGPFACAGCRGEYLYRITTYIMYLESRPYRYLRGLHFLRSIAAPSYGKAPDSLATPDETQSLTSGSSRISVSGSGKVDTVRLRHLPYRPGILPAARAWCPIASRCHDEHLRPERPAPAVARPASCVAAFRARERTGKISVDPSPRTAGKALPEGERPQVLSRLAARDHCGRYVTRSDNGSIAWIE